MIRSAGFVFVEGRGTLCGSPIPCCLKILLAKSVRARKFATNQTRRALVNQIG
jgi:hypothetical protein